MLYWVYIIECKDKSLYTGWTTDLKKRVAAHNAGTAAKYTRGRGPVKLVYKQRFLSREKAMKREYAIKLLSRPEKLALVGSRRRGG